MTISVDISSKPHLCWFLLKSSDLDTSDDFSAELERSHGFFTASGEAQRRHHVTNTLPCQIISSPAPDFLKTVFCTCGVLLTSATRVILHDRKIHHRTTAQTQNMPTRSMFCGLTSSGFSDAFRLRKRKDRFRIEVIFTREGTRKIKMKINK